MEAALERGSVIGGFGFVDEEGIHDIAFAMQNKLSTGIKKALGTDESDEGLVTIHEIAPHDDDKYTI